MLNLPTIEIPTITQSLDDLNNYQNEVIVAPVSYDSYGDEYFQKNFGPVRVDAMSILIVFQGEAEVNIDFKDYKIEKGNTLSMMPSHIRKFISMSRDFKGELLIISRLFIQFISQSMQNRTFSISKMQLLKNPVYPLEEKDILILHERFVDIIAAIRNKEHCFQQKKIILSIISMLLDMADMLKKDGYFEADLSLMLTRKEQLFENFLDLLMLNIKNEHKVKFYADKLFITPQYLSLILRDQTGQSANRWIDNSLIMEAKTLLKLPSMSVKQVSVDLHFPDQSTFGKFFKNQTGLSPLEYRKS